MPSPHPSPKALASADRYRTLLEINNAIITNLTQEGLFHAICGALERVLPVYRACITLYDPGADTIRLIAVSPYWKSEYFTTGAVVNRKDSVSIRAVDSQRP